MVVVEERTNYPSVLGRKNIPTERTWPPGRPIGTLPAVEHLRKGLLPQILRRPRLIRRPLGEEMAVYTEEEIHSQNIQYRHQIARYPIIPLIDRPHPLLDWVKARAPIIPRTKLIGVFGIVDPKNIPKPWGPMEWPEEAEVARLPSVIGILPGPTRTMHPKRTISVVV